MSVRPMASPLRAAQSARDAFAPPPEPMRSGPGPHPPVLGQRPPFPPARQKTQGSLPAPLKRPEQADPFAPPAPKAAPPQRQQRSTPPAQRSVQPRPSVSNTGRPYYTEDAPQPRPLQPQQSSRQGSAAPAYPPRPTQPPHRQNASYPPPAYTAGRSSRISPVQAKFSAYENAYSEELPYESDSSYDPYAARRNTLAGDPYDNYRPQNNWMKWLPTILSGVVFLICLILLILLLTD